MFLQLFIVAVLAMAGLACLRLAEALRGRPLLPEGKGRTKLLAFIVVPPLALGALLQPPPGGGLLGGIFWIPVYALLVGALKLGMLIAAVVVDQFVRGRSRRLLLAALIGNEGDPDDVPFNPPVTTRLAESMALVERTNGAFPRGVDFPTQVDRADFGSAWGALDEATRSLEARIADDRGRGLGVASAATATAIDARGRLHTLRGIADARAEAVPA